jgi:retron-type reverse transcriptase
VTVDSDEQNLEVNFADLRARTRGALPAAAVRRVTIPEPDGGVRRFDIPTREEKPSRARWPRC